MLHNTPHSPLSLKETHRGDLWPPDIHRQNTRYVTRKKKVSSKWRVSPQPPRAPTSRGNSFPAFPFKVIDLSLTMVEVTLSIFYVNKLSGCATHETSTWALFTPWRQDTVGWICFGAESPRTILVKISYVVAQLLVMLHHSAEFTWACCVRTCSPVTYVTEAQRLQKDVLWWEWLAQDPKPLCAELERKVRMGVVKFISSLDGRFSLCLQLSITSILKSSIEQWSAYPEIVLTSSNKQMWCRLADTFQFR